MRRMQLYTVPSCHMLFVSKLPYLHCLHTKIESWRTSTASTCSLLSDTLNFDLGSLPWLQGKQEAGQGLPLPQHPPLGPPGGAPQGIAPAKGSARAQTRGSSAQAAPSTLCACPRTRYSSTPHTFQPQLQLQMPSQTGAQHLQQLVCLAVARQCC